MRSRTDSRRSRPGGPAVEMARDDRREIEAPLDDLDLAIVSLSPGPEAHPHVVRLCSWLLELRARRKEDEDRA